MKFDLRNIVKESIREAFYKPAFSPKKEIMDQPGEVASGDFGAGFPPLDTYEENTSNKPNLKTNNPQFKKWFGKSKVVDKSGKPLVVYHGTDFGNDFSSFHPHSHFGNIEQANYVIHQSKNYNNTARIIPVYLSIQKPKRVKDALHHSDFDPHGYYGNTMDKVWKNMAREAKSEGYDGLVYENEWGGEGDSWVTFEPTQIKSALGNNGNFNPKDPNILHEELFLLEESTREIDLWLENKQ